MRTLIIASLFVFAACAAPKAPRTPLNTSTASTTGSSKSTTIGSSGGTATSTDGKLSLIIPAGAVSSDTVFTVTPIEKPGSMSLAAYRLEPEGTTFATAATVKFTFNDEDLLGTRSESLLVGYQLSDGTWQQVSPLGAPANDSVQVNTTHLSDWSAFAGFQLRPGEARVKVGLSLPIFVKDCPVIQAGDDGLTPLMSDCDEDADDPDLTPNLIDWSVNSVVGGNASIGTVERQGENRVLYVAPQALPDPELVAVSVKLNNALLVSNVQVFDGDTEYPKAYEGSFTYNYRSGGFSNVGLEEYTATGQVHLSRIGTSARYQMSGGLTVASYTVERAGCLCTGSFTGNIGDDDDLLEIGDGTYSWSFGSDGTASLNCSPKDGTSSCPTGDASWTIGWGFAAPSCVGDFDNHWRSLTTFESGWSDTCTSNGITRSQQTMTFSFTKSTE